MKGLFRLVSKATFLVLFLILTLFLPWKSLSKESIETTSSSKNSSQIKSLKDLEDNDRQRDIHFRIDQALDILGIQPGMTVGEVGAGEGYLVFKLADRVGPKGKIYAEDIFPEPLEVLNNRAPQMGFQNIETVIGSPDDPKLPSGTFDFVFMHATIQFVNDPVKLFNAIAPCLKNNGKFILIEGEDGSFLSMTGVSPPEGTFPSRERYLDIFSKTVFTLDRIDDTTLPYLTIFVLRFAGEGRPWPRTRRNLEIGLNPI